VWVAGIALIGFLPRLCDDLRIIPALLGVMLIITAFGPWGVLQVSASDQHARLERVLTEKGWLVNGRWQETAPETPLPWNAPDRKKIRGALRILKNVGEIDRLRPWFAGQPDDPFHKTAAMRYSSLENKLNVGPTNYHQLKHGIHIEYKLIHPFIFTNTEDSYLIGPIFLISSKINNSTYETPEGPLVVNRRENILTIENDKGQRATFDLSIILKSLPKKPVGDLARHKPWRVDGSGNLPVKLAFTELVGDINGESVTIGIYLGFFIVLPRTQ
jgi:hypothetical protein